MSLRRWVDELGSWLGYELISRKGNAHIFAEKTEEQGNNSYSKHQQKSFTEESSDFALAGWRYELIHLWVLADNNSKKCPIIYCSFAPHKGQFTEQEKKGLQRCKFYPPLIIKHLQTLHIYHSVKGMLSPCKSIPFTRRKHVFEEIKGCFWADQSILLAIKNKKKQPFNAKNTFF